MERQNRLTGSYFKIKNVDFLKIRLQRMVRSMLQEESHQGFSCLLSEDHHAVKRGIWIPIIALCLGLFLYQSYERTTFYLTYPVTTDVFITKKLYQTPPEITICYQETELVLKHYRTQFPFCHIVVMPMLLAYRRFSVEELWKMVNTTTAIFSAKEISTTVEDLAFSSDPLTFGTCTTFESASKRAILTDEGRFEIIFKLYPGHRCRKSSTTKMYVHDAGEFLQSRKELSSIPGKLNVLGLTVRKVKFLNRTNNLCVHTADYKKCREECVIRYSMKQGICRFPFHPPYAKLNPCVYHSVQRDYYSINQYFDGRIIEEICDCPRRCEYRTFDSRDTTLEDYDNMTKILLHFDDPHETVIRERYIYDLIKLLSDIGGLSGLYIGLSMLSLFEFIPQIIKTRKNKPNFKLTDPLYFKVVRTYNRCKESRTVCKPNFHNISRTARIIRNGAIVICFGIFVFGIINRTMYYFQYPMRSIVEISFNSSLVTPSITICPGDNNVLELQKLYADIYNISDKCQVKIWQLLDLHGINATHLWINPQQITNKEFWITANPIYLQDGTCANLDVSGMKKDLSQTSSSLVPIQRKTTAAANRELLITSLLPDICGTNYQKVYITVPTTHFDYFQYRHLINSRFHQILFIIKEIKIDKKYKSCIQEEQNVACKEKCLTKKLWERIHCRLPYMPESPLPVCSTSETARHSYLTYQELFTLPSSSEDCNCLPPCRQTFYETRVSSQKQGQTAFTFGASHNVIETYAKMPSYSIIALLSDIGGWLGSTLGLCMLTTFRLLFANK